MIPANDMKSLIIDVFEQLVILETHQFKQKAYNNVIELFFTYEGQITNTIDFTQFYGIGNGIQNKIYEVIDTGTCKKLESLKETSPYKITDLRELTKIQGIGIVTAKKLIKQGLKSLKDLEKAIKDGKLSSSYQTKIDQAKIGRIPYTLGKQIADQVIKSIKSTKILGRIDIGGSLRRKKSNVKDVDIIVEIISPNDEDKVVKAIEKIATLVYSKGHSMNSFNIDSFQVDVKFTVPDNYGAMLNHFTGSREFNVETRKLAIKRGLFINDKGIYEKK